MYCVGQNAVIDISLFINTYSYVDFCYEYDITEIMVRHHKQESLVERMW